MKINKWLNSKRSDGIPLIEIQVRKPIKRNIKQQRQSLLPQIISNTTISSIHEYGLNWKFVFFVIDDCLWLESSYTIYILTQDFQSDIVKPSIFIDLITDEILSTNYMRINTNVSIRENLEKNVFGKFQAYGKRIENVYDFSFSQ